MVQPEDSDEFTLRQSAATPQTPQTLDPEQKQPTSARMLNPGEVISDRYVVISYIGKGGIGSVYRVEQTFLKKQFALKILNTLGASPGTIMRFHQEAQASAKLHHKNIVGAIDFGITDDGEPFFVMELVEGKSLARILRAQKRLPLDVVLEIFIPLAEGMAYAHKEGIVHRDLKPGNIVLEPDEESKRQYIPKLIDFGLAKVARDEANTNQSITRLGDVLGTPLYMSPEQCNGKAVDNRSDIYSLGCVMFECLTGVPPLKGDTAMKTFMMHGSSKPPLLREASGGLEFSEDMEFLIATMLAKDPWDRFQNCTQVAERLAAIKDTEAKRSTEGITEAIAQIAGDQSSPKMTLPTTALLVTLAILSVLVISYVVWTSFTRQTPVASDTFKEAPFDSILIDAGGNVKESLKKYPKIDRNEPFSKTYKGARVFQFPVGEHLGELQWWTGSGTAFNTVQAHGTAELPEGSKTVFRVFKHLYFHPEIAGLFRDGDYTALELEPDLIWMPNDDIVSAVIVNLLKDKPVTAVLLKSIKVEPPILKALNDSNKLVWLHLRDCEVEAQDIANLKNLTRLNLLSINTVKKVTPIIDKLISKPVPLQRLSVRDCQLADEDLKKICRIKTLNVLNIGENHSDIGADAQRKKFIIQNLASLPNLRILCIDNEVLSDDPMPLFSKGKLKKLYVRGIKIIDPEYKRLRKMLPKNCEIKVGTDMTVKAWRELFKLQTSLDLW